MSKLLIVDDSATMRKIISRVLRQADLRVETILEAGDGNEGLARLASDPDIELILSDINMPGMNGIDFLKCVRAKLPMEVMPVVMISTESGEEMTRAAMEGGANGFVKKPFTPDSIHQALAKYLG